MGCFKIFKFWEIEWVFRGGDTKKLFILFMWLNLTELYFKDGVQTTPYRTQDLYALQLLIIW